MSVTESDKEWACSCDIEVALPHAPPDIAAQLERMLSPDYGVENRSDRGWGIVIVRHQEWYGDRRKLSLCITEFIADLEHLDLPNINIGDASPIVRVGVYYDTFSFTLTLSNEAMISLQSAKATLEVSLYPSNN
jgi:hypothetical protein